MLVSVIEKKQVYEVQKNKEPLHKGDLIWISELDGSICAYSDFGKNGKKTIRNDIVEADMDFKLKKTDKYIVFGCSIVPQKAMKKEKRYTPDELIDYMVENDLHEDATVMVFFNDDGYYFTNVEGKVIRENGELIFEHHISGCPEDTMCVGLDEDAEKLIGKYVIGFTIESNDGVTFLLLPFMEDETEEDVVTSAYGMLLMDYMEYANINTISKLKEKITQSRCKARKLGAEI